MSDYKYKFSVIMAVYNVEEFLAEAIESIVNQTIGLKNIQLILVDDGSSDGSEKICDKYAAKYPKNIFVIHKENGGVSSARNLALDKTEGKYINFLDGDDKLELRSLSEAWKFFEKHYEETDIVAMPIKFFDAARGEHMLNYKFKDGSRIIDLNEYWNYVQMSASSTFIKAEKLKDIRFDVALAYAEDAKVIQTILMEKQTLGLLKEAAYLYRKRQLGTSAIQMSGTKANWYLPVVKNFHLHIIMLAIERLGFVPRYLQNTLMYDLQWRIKKAVVEAEGLGEEEKEEYVNVIKRLLTYIDDDIIVSQAHYWGEHKILALKMKYAKDIGFVTEPLPALCFTEENLFPIEFCKAVVEFIDIKDGFVQMDCSVSLYDEEYKDLGFFVTVNNERMDAENFIKRDKVTALGHDIVAKYSFNAKAKLKAKNEITIGANLNGCEVIFNKIQFGKYTPVNKKYVNSYCILDDYIIHRSGNALLISKKSFFKNIKRELKLCLEIFKRDGKLGMGAAIIRPMLFIYKLFKRKPLWLISDRPASAGDNGEAFFTYMRKNHKEIDARFVLMADSSDFERMSKIGPVLVKDSLKHKLLSAVSEYIVSSHGEPEIFCPLRSRVEPFKNFWAKVKFVFLQHGVTKDDLSSWLNKYNKNFTGFVVSANAEYDSILEYDYYYSSENVWLTGMPRFDTLYDNSQKVVSIMPTWRKNLTAGQNAATGGWNIIEDFKESDFYKFYNGLINHPEILKTAKKTGYAVEFLLHPNLFESESLFEKNDVVKVVNTSINYNKLFAESDLIVTDYSSTVFDFVYLQKPVLYTHFDKEEFFGGAHSYSKGYFDYERDGFGEVEYDLESTVQRIVEYMENGCKLKDKYKERINRFFAFNDKNNCERVYQKMIELRK